VFPLQHRKHLYFDPEQRGVIARVSEHFEKTNSVSIRLARKNDLDEVYALLRECGLPWEGFSDHLATALVLVANDKIVGSAALESYHDGVLLRSVCVSLAFRGQGLGRRIVRRILALSGNRPCFLLTTTAPKYFEKYGFHIISRDEASPGVRQSIEFKSICPEDAVAMLRPAD